MTTIYIMLLIFLVASLVLCVFLFCRNDKVHDFRIKVLHESEYEVEKGIFKPFSYMASYDEMMRRFWKPLKDPNDWIK